MTAEILFVGENGEGGGTVLLIGEGDDVGGDLRLNSAMMPVSEASRACRSDGLGAATKSPLTEAAARMAASSVRLVAMICWRISFIGLMGLMSLMGLMGRVMS